MLYIISKKSGSHSEIKKIKNIREEASKKTSDSFSDDSGSDSLLSINSSWETYRRPAGRKAMNRLDHVVTDNFKNYKGQSNEAINSEPIFILVVLIYLEVLATPYQ